MNKITLSVLAAFAVTSSAFAAAKDFKQPVAPQFFKDTEVALDAFYSYNDAQPRSPKQYFTDRSGGGVGVNYFFQRYFGVDVEGNWWKGAQADKKETVSQVTANLIIRYPIEFTSFGVAPYILGGGGAAFSDQNCGFSDVGAGVEVRLTPQVGIFSDWRWNFMTGGNRNDETTTRAGVRFVF